MSNQPPDSGPKTVLQAIEGMTLSLNPDEAKELNATIQFHVSGEGGGNYYLSIADGKCDFSAGDQPRRDGRSGCLHGAKIYRRRRF